MLLGRRRRYFGYPHDVEHYIDTPSSAKSFASYISPAQSITNCRVELQTQNKLIPKPKVPNRYADRYLRTAIATQIPALLPPMKNTFRFTEYEQNPKKFIIPPQMEHHFERSLYYVWLSKNDRTELCDIVDSHLGSRGKRGRNLQGNATEYREIGNPIQRSPLVEHFSLPPTTLLRGVKTNSAKTKSLKLNFQKGPWDPPKTPRDRFVRDHGKSPAIEGISHDYPGNDETRVTETDIQDCLLAAKRLLGPYAGLNTALGSYTQQNIPDELLYMIEQNDLEDKKAEYKKKEDGFAKRPFGYNSSQIKYERQLNAAMNYYNRIKLGHRHPTPPQEIFRKLIRYRGKLVGIKTKAETRHSMKGAGLENPNVKRKFNKANVTEEDYMDMYVHFLGPDDTHVKKPVRSLTDVTKIRKKMHLDENSSDDEQNENIAELIRQDSFSDIQDLFVRKLMRGDINPLDKNSELTEKDSKIVNEIIGEHLNNPPGPKIKEIFKKFGSQHGSVESSVANLLVVASKQTINEDNIDEDENNEEDELDLELGFVSEIPVQLVNEIEIPSSNSESLAELSLASSSDTDVSSQNAASIQFPGNDCHMNDLECLSNAGVLGTPPFGKKKIDPNLLNEESVNDLEDNDDNAKEKPLFAINNWVYKQKK